MAAKLFTPFDLGRLRLANRIVVAPMCTYSASEGCANDWHLIHYGQLALSGAGLLTVEATSVTPDGRITYGDLGLWDDTCEAALAKMLESIRRWSQMPVAIQIAHAGRKASTDLPWLGSTQLPPNHAHGWQTVSSSNLPFQDGEHAPPPSTATDSIACAMPSPVPRAAPCASASMPFRCTALTAILCTSSCRRSPTAVTTIMAAAWKTGCAFRWRCLRQCAMPCPIILR